MFAILNQTEAGKVIIRGFQEREEAFITSLERQEVVRVCVQHLISLPSQYYPSAVIKERMAEAIVTAFPCLAYKAEGSNTLQDNRINGKARYFLPNLMTKIC